MVEFTPQSKRGRCSVLFLFRLFFIRIYFHFYRKSVHSESWWILFLRTPNLTSLRLSEVSRMIYFPPLHRENAMRKMFVYLWITVNGKYRLFIVRFHREMIYEIFMETYIFMSIHEAMGSMDIYRIMAFIIIMNILNIFCVFICLYYCIFVFIYFSIFYLFLKFLITFVDRF